MKLLALTLLMSLVAPMPVAFAQSTYDDLDDSGSKRTKEKKTSKKKAITESEVVREIERGFYAKAPIGSTLYLDTYGATALSGNPIIRPGTYLALAVGQDFVDQERSSIAWELAFAQGVHNGEVFDELVALGMAPEQIIQGDLRTLNMLGNLEFSFYPARRLGIGLRAGGGVMFAPYLVNTEFFQEKKGQAPPIVHQTPHPIGFGGPTIEYYTKLSHFSVGLDVDVSYQIGFDLATTIAGYFKYSF
jgi:hypothetical protein